MPVIPVGSTDRIDPVEADAWRKARGRRPTTPKPKAKTNDADIDISDALAKGGLRAVDGGRAR
jgi:hypothetical protein